MSIWNESRLHHDGCSRREILKAKHSMESQNMGNTSVVGGEMVAIPKLNQWSLYEKICYGLDVLVPEDESREMFVPKGHMLQKIKDPIATLPPIFADSSNKRQPDYFVQVLRKSFFKALDPSSNFLKKWDAMALSLLFFTASVTPFETAFMTNSTDTTINIDMLFLINRFVDIIFFTDIFIQMRTPFRDEESGRLVFSVKKIAARYLKSWFMLDLISVLPFEFLGNILATSSGDGSDLTQLSLLRFFRLTRLLKLLRVFRASRKLKNLQVSSGIRFVALEIIKIVVSTTFIIHWLACGYRLAGERGTPEEAPGWPDFLKIANNGTATVAGEYFAALGYSSGLVTLVGQSNPVMAPTNDREFLYSAIANVVAYLMFLFFLTNFSHILQISKDISRKQEILADNYLELLDDLRLDKSLKFLVYGHLTSHFSTLSNARNAKMLSDLPVALHGFISLQTFIDFVERIPWLEPFIDREPELIQEICRSISIISVSQNDFLFTEGYDGIYQVERGLLASQGRLFMTGRIFGNTCLRDNIKKCECRALTEARLRFLPRKELVRILEGYPKIKYYAKRWIAWKLVQQYIFVYSQLYLKAAKRGALMDPPLLSNRPNLGADDIDDIDVAVLDHIEENNF